MIDVLFFFYKFLVSGSMISIILAVTGCFSFPSCRMNINFSSRWSTGLKSYQVKRYPKGIETGLLRKGLPKPVHNEWPILNWKPVSFRVFSCLNINHIIWLIGMVLPNLTTFLVAWRFVNFLDVFGIFEIFHTWNAQPPNCQASLNLWLLYRWFHNCTS